MDPLTLLMDKITLLITESFFIPCVQGRLLSPHQTIDCNRLSIKTFLSLSLAWAGNRIHCIYSGKAVARWIHWNKIPCYLSAWFICCMLLTYIIVLVFTINSRVKKMNNIPKANNRKKQRLKSCFLNDMFELFDDASIIDSTIFLLLLKTPVTHTHN